MGESLYGKHWSYLWGKNPPHRGRKTANLAAETPDDAAVLERKRRAQGGARSTILTAGQAALGPASRAAPAAGTKVSGY